MLIGSNCSYLCYLGEIVRFCLWQTILWRSAAVDSTGREFNRNRLIALLSAIVLEEVSYALNHFHHYRDWVSHILYINRFLCSDVLSLSIQHPGTTIVTDSVTSDGLTSFIEKKLGMPTIYHHVVFFSVNFWLTQTCFRGKASQVQKRLQECHRWSYSLGNKSGWSYLLRTHALVPIVVRYLSCARLDTVSESVEYRKW